MEKPTSGYVCLNVGCGLSVGQNWVNIDASYSLLLSRIPAMGKIIAKAFTFPPWPKSIMYGDIVRGLKIPKSSCQLIFASHVVQHLSERDALCALGSIYPYLSPAGVFRGTVPDLERYERQTLE